MPNLLRPLFQKYVPAEHVEQRVQDILSNPSRVLVVVHPEKILSL